VVNPTILIDGTDVQTAKRTLVDVEGVIDTPTFRGEDIPIPYAHGELATQKYRAAKTVVLFLAVVGDDADDLQAELATLFALLPITPATATEPVDTTCTLTRRLTAGDTTASASYLGGADPVFVTPRFARLTLRFKLLTGQWA
jgi:hypothetical protein